MKTDASNWIPGIKKKVKSYLKMQSRERNFLSAGQVCRLTGECECVCSELHAGI